MVFSRLTRGLERFADSNNMPWDLPTQYCKSSAWLSHQCYSSGNDVDVPMIRGGLFTGLYQISKKISVQMTFGLSDGSGKSLLGKVSFHMGMIASINLPKFVRRQRFGDCFEIHIHQ